MDDFILYYDEILYENKPNLESKYGQFIYKTAGIECNSRADVLKFIDNNDISLLEEITIEDNYLIQIVIIYEDINILNLLITKGINLLGIGSYILYTTVLFATYHEKYNILGAILAHLENEHYQYALFSRISFNFLSSLTKNDIDLIIEYIDMGQKLMLKKRLKLLRELFAVAPYLDMTIDVYRGTQKPSRLDSLSLMSTTLDKNIALTFTNRRDCCMMNISLPAGIKILPIFLLFPYEWEILLYNNTYTVVNKMDHNVTINEDVILLTIYYISVTPNLYSL